MRWIALLIALAGFGTMQAQTVVDKGDLPTSGDQGSQVIHIRQEAVPVFGNSLPQVERSVIVNGEGTPEGRADVLHLEGQAIPVLPGMPLPTVPKEIVGAGGPEGRGGEVIIMAPVEAVRLTRLTPLVPEASDE